LVIKLNLKIIFIAEFRNISGEAFNNADATIVKYMSFNTGTSIDL